MAAKVFSSTQADALALAAVVDKALGLPARGTDIGGGVHIPGWTLQWDLPTNIGAVYSYTIHPVVAAIPGDPTKLALLTPGEQTTLQAAIAAAI